MEFLRIKRVAALSLLALVAFTTQSLAQGSGKVYYSDCNSSTNPTPFYEYDVATDVWVAKASLPDNNTTQLCADAAGNVFCLPEDANIYQYDAGLDQWQLLMPGPAASAGRNAIAMLETDQGEFYWANDGTTTLHYTVGGAWTSITTPRSISCAADFDRSAGLLYIRTYRERGFFVFDPATGTFPTICDDTTGVSENGRSGVYFNGEFLDREFSGNYIAYDVTNCNWQDTGTAPTSTHSSSAVDANGNIYSNGWNDDTVFEVYNIPANTLTTLAAAPDIPGNAHSTLVVSEAGASWRNYGSGFPGTIGVPGFVASGAPFLGQPITLTADNSDGTNRIGGFLAVGLSQIQVPGSWGGDLLVNPDILLQAVSIPVTGLVLSSTLPTDPSLDGVSVFLQVLEFDTGAVKGISNTPGLELLLGQ